MKNIESIFLSNALRASIEIIDILDSKKPMLYASHFIGAGGDVSIGADLVSEEIFYKYLGGFYNFDSEESGFLESKIKTNLVVVIDPLDGSDNFVSNIPYYGASLALCCGREVLEALVINFVSKEISYASKEILKDSKRPIFFNLNSIISLLPLVVKCSDSYVLGIKCGVYEGAYSNLVFTKKFMDNKIKFRSLGALALSLGFSSLYNFVFFPGKIRKYDGVAGLFLSQESYIFGNIDYLHTSFSIDNLFARYHEMEKIFNEKIQNWILITNNKIVIKKILGVDNGIY